jgi:hypothetical protein
LQCFLFENKGGEAMNSVFILLVWLVVAFVIGVVFGKFCAVGSGLNGQILKFCAVGSGLNAQILEKFSMESDTLMNNLIPIDDSVEEVA